ncbi:hypothetical protein P691DRAFT_592176 [Macrolepiota fuliginosa MF-IS2]|uniref:Uncharacterized protein n=1 Tax=Macrolepiota fuliginosa MF-IS2 TaxID=1400762 RepID=A0A9P5XEY7_9AGAR|nr:hypothetical protein P691DRAFT_592176 [Macrolepiota fuliginosa MF-IS2]
MNSVGSWYALFDKNNDSADTNTNSVRSTGTKIYSPWISDSLISPPSYHKLRRRKAASEWDAKEDMGPPVSPTPDHVIHDILDVESIQASTGTQGGGPRSPKPRMTKPSATRTDANRNGGEDIENVGDGEGDAKSTRGSGSSQSRRIPTTKRTRSGTIVQNNGANHRPAGKRNRSGTIVQGGGGARRTRSGTVVQAKPGVIGGQRQDLDGQQESKRSLQDETCSCCSSDDELMLRSHSHCNLDTEDLEWKVAEPPSPVARRLRRAKRRSALNARRRNKPRSRRGGLTVGDVAEEAEEDGMDGDIEDDELDFLGTFVPEDW